jgi:hypothetical protein
LMLVIVNMAGHIVIDAFYITLCVTCSANARWPTFLRWLSGVDPYYNNK